MVMMNWRGTQPIPSVEAEATEHLRHLLTTGTRIGWALSGWVPPGGWTLDRARSHLAGGNEEEAMAIIRRAAREVARPLLTVVTDGRWSRPTVRDWAEAQFEEMGAQVPGDFSPLKRDWWRRQYVTMFLPREVALVSIHPLRYSWNDPGNGIITVHPRVARKVAL